MSRPRAAETLREYLASHDISCEGCGYNLRGVDSVQCPECGTVIPRPPSEYIARRTADEATLQLACQDCGYTVRGVNAQRCPECGSRRLQRYSGDTPPRFRRWRRLPPIGVIILAGGSGIVMITCISAALARAAGGRGRGDPWIGVLLSFIPMIICGAWIWWRVPLARMEPGERKAVATLAIIMSVVCLVLALRTLA